MRRRESSVKLTFADKVRGWFSPEYAARAPALRLQASLCRDEVGYGRTSGRSTRIDNDWSGVQYGPEGLRDLSPGKRMEQVKRSRKIDQENMLGSALLDRAVDNIIGEDMVVQPRTADEGWNREAGELFNNSWSPDVRMVMTRAELYRAWYRAKLRDGDMGIVLLRDGQVQSIEGDLVRSPGMLDGDTTTRDGSRDIIEGVEVDAAGRPFGFHIARRSRVARAAESARVSSRDFIWCIRNDRLHREAIRGVPVLAQLGWLLEQIDGTVEAVVTAHRMASMFGAMIKRDNPSGSFGGLRGNVTNARGDAQAAFDMEPGMVQYLAPGESVEQVKPEHPHTAFSEFMSFLIRLAGLKLGLPLELALLDYSRTNYSSARASMEQAYRRFRIEQRHFAQCVISRLYRWRVSKWMKEGGLSARDDAWQHRVLGQPWPYLDPVKDVQGSLIAVDAGMSTLSDELRKRGMEFDEWLETRAMEVQKIAATDVSVSKSNLTRDAETVDATMEGNDDEQATETDQA